jgi:hypothetical protein
MLGHSSATVTLETYGHLFDDRLDEVSCALRRARQPVEVPERRPVQRIVATVAARSPQSPATQAPVAHTLPKGDAGNTSAHRAERRSAGQASNSIGRPRKDSNLRSRLRRAVLYPLSYGGSGGTTIPAAVMPTKTGVSAAGSPIRVLEVGRGSGWRADTLAG